jgi:predicted nuclease of predicted toxin-antitoxin system
MGLKLLLDANISWRSMAMLKQHFDDCFHVDSIGLKIPAKDIEIWEYAKRHDLIIVSNDDDFLDLSEIKGFPPKVILLKTGNQSRKITEDLLIKIKLQITEFQMFAEYGVLEIYMN